VSGSSQNPAPDPQTDPRTVPARSAKPFRCADIESAAVLYACDELDPQERSNLDAHLAGCADCATAVKREAHLHSAIVSFGQPADSLDRSGLLLARCRSELSEKLDDERAKSGKSPWRMVSPASWWETLRHTLIYHPAPTMAMLLVAGFIAGVAGQRTSIPVPPPVIVAQRPASMAPVSSASTPRPQLTDQQLQSVDNAHIAWVTPSGSRTPTVQVQLMSPVPMDIVGAPDDADIERALMFVLRNERFDPDARIDSLDVLRTRAADAGVRESLLAAARMDPDPGVRIKALEALQGYQGDASVWQALLDSLESDDNAGVRVTAVSLLVSALGAQAAAAGSVDPQTVEVLRDRQHNDPNRYVRLQSAAALRQIGAQ
jgi:hypothetical protein